MIGKATTYGYAANVDLVATRDSAIVNAALLRLCRGSSDISERSLSKLIS